MTRKHFKALAAALASVYPKGRGWKQACEAIASACPQFNQAFRREQFLRACGYYEEANQGED